jgi:CspA family cold shock protein
MTNRANTAFKLGNVMQTGIVNRFNKIKGYGFITPDVGETEVFVHFSQVQTEGYKELKEGQRISYILSQGERGEFATEVKVIS